MQHVRLADHIVTLFRAYQSQNWWPGRSRFEVVVGAILVQNTAWGNVEQALGNLRRARALTPQAIRRTRGNELEALVRPAGFFRQKAATIKRFVDLLDRAHAGSIDRFLAQQTANSRQQLLAVKGIGPETADSILLYAGGHPIFVVDGYTRRIWERHGLAKPQIPFSYERVQAAFEDTIGGLPELATTGALPSRHPPSAMSRRPVPPRTQVYKELHAMIVRVGSTFCRATPDCAECPLRSLR